MEQTSNNKEKPRPRRWLMYTSFIVVLVLAGVLIADTQGFFCSGACAVIGCHPSNPCTYKGKQYTAGMMCNPADTFVCDAGIVIECYCKTFTVRGAPNTLDCVCQ